MEIGETLTRKLGPLPVWAWGAVVGGAVVVYGFVAGGDDEGASSPFVQPVAGGTPFDYEAPGIGGGASGGGTTTPTAPAFSIPAGMDIGQWVQVLRLQFPQTAANWRAIVGTGSPTETVEDRLARLQREAAFLTEYGPDESTPASPTSPVTPPVASGSAPRGYAAAGSPTTTARGDTSAQEPPVIGLGLDRATAIDRTDALRAATFALPAPSAPSHAIGIPGTFPALPPILAAQGDTRDALSLRRLDPQGIAAAVRARARVATPTTRARMRIPRQVNTLRQRFQTTQTG